MVKFLTPSSLIFAMAYSGIPHRPNPPTKSVTPSFISLKASFKFVIILFIFYLSISSTAAIPCPPPTHKVAKPKFLPLALKA